MNITKNQIISALSSLSIDDIREINEAAYNISKADRTIEIAKAKRKLYVGQTVEWNGKYGHNSGRIVKVNRTKCVIETGTGSGPYDSQKWTVPMTMLKAI